VGKKIRKNSLGIFGDLPPTSSESVGQLGKMVGIVEALSPSKNEKLKSPQVEKASAYFSKELKDHAASASPETSKEFFVERADAAKIREKIVFMPQRTKICLLLASGWPVVEEMRRTEKSSITGDLHGWLLSQKDDSGKNILDHRIDSRETRKICEAIGLEFRNQWNKP
jgi:hypothetical protein